MKQGLTYAGALVSLAAAVVLLCGWGGNSSAAAVASGVAIMAACGLPAYRVLRWGRSRSNAEFLSAVVGTMLCKMTVVAVALLAVWKLTAMPRLPFVWGLM